MCEGEIEMVKDWVAGKLGRVIDRPVGLAVFVKFRLELVEEGHFYTVI